MLLTQTSPRCTECNPTLPAINGQCTNRHIACPELFSLYILLTVPNVTVHPPVNGQCTNRHIAL